MTYLEKAAQVLKINEDPGLMVLVGSDCPDNIFEMHITPRECSETGGCANCWGKPYLSEDIRKDLFVVGFGGEK